MKDRKKQESVKVMYSKKRGKTEGLFCERVLKAGKAVGILTAAFLMAGCSLGGMPVSGESDMARQESMAGGTDNETQMNGIGQEREEQAEGAGKENGAQTDDGQTEEDVQENGAQTDGGQTDGAGKENGAQKADGQTEGEAGGHKLEQEPEITLVMVGDILLHTPVAESGRLEEGGYDFHSIFREMQEEISQADLALVNQEVIIGGEELGISGYPAFNAPYELGDALADAGFDVVLHATNHALDKGKRGLLNCLDFWQDNYPEISVLGVHESRESQEEIYVYEQEGIRIAILNYTYGTNGIPLPEDMPWAVDMLEEERVLSDLAKAREAADFIIVCPHWGTEYRLEASREQEYWAELFAENGADLVLGTHPHVIEPVEWVGQSGREDPDEAGEGGMYPEEEGMHPEEEGMYPKEDGMDSEEGGMHPEEAVMAPGKAGKDTLVYYSLGNFVNWTAGTGEGVANRMVGGMAKVTIGWDEEGKVCIRSYDVVPLVCHVEQGFGGVRVYPLASYTEELAQRNEIRKQDENFSLDYCRKLVREVFGVIDE